jgi:hypothetical protein
MSRFSAGDGTVPAFKIGMDGDFVKTRGMEHLRDRPALAPADLDDHPPAGGQVVRRPRQDRAIGAQSIGLQPFAQLHTQATGGAGQQQLIVAPD